MGGEDTPRAQRLSKLVLVACLALFAGKAVLSLTQESATWDETHYFGLGRYLLQEGRWDVRGSILHPPLAFYVSSIPLLLSDWDPALWEREPALAKDRTYRGTADVGRGRALLSAPANHGDRLLTRSRSMMVLLGLLLGAFVFRWARALYGPWSAALAVALFAFCPNLLAHTRLITPDIALTTFFLLAMYFFWRTLRLASTRYAAATGLCLGLALLSKFTALLLLPVMLVLALLWRLSHKQTSLRHYAIILVVATTVLLSGYRFSIEPYVSGIVYQWQHARAGQDAFCLGQYSQHGWWYYVLVAFALKTPLALVTLLLAALLLYVKANLAAKRTDHLLDEAFLLVPTATVVVFFIVEHQSIGLRYILPVYPFLFIFASRLMTATSSWRRVVPIVAALGWYVAASSRIHPHYLAYFNELAGGPDRGHRYLTDSNLDWGQDLKGLAHFMRERGIDRVSLSYFGSDDPGRYGIAYDWLPSMMLRNPTPGGPLRFNRYVAISATNLQGVHFADHHLFAFFKARNPVAKIGYSIFVYDLQDPVGAPQGLRGEMQ